MTALPEQRVLHVLVLENDRMLGGLVQLVLQRKGWTVTCVLDARAAVGSLSTELPDVLLMDLMQTDSSGYEVLDWIKKTNPSWLPHVIVFTAASIKVIEDLQRNHQVCRVLRKPFDIT